MKLVYSSLIVCLLFQIDVLAQFDKKYENKNSGENSQSTSVNFGIGLGLDYGGIGGRLTVFPEEHVGVFGAVGYALAGVGYNAGLSFRILPKNPGLCPTATIMYGYNAAIKISGASQYDKIYYGPSIGAGLEIRSKRKNTNFYSIELLIPFRPSEYDSDYNNLNNLGVKISAAPLPFTVSVGYHFGFKKK